jgi:hypothetical protein
MGRKPIYASDNDRKRSYDEERRARGCEYVGHFWLEPAEAKALRRFMREGGDATRQAAIRRLILETL